MGCFFWARWNRWKVRVGLSRLRRGCVAWLVGEVHRSQADTNSPEDKVTPSQGGNSSRKGQVSNDGPVAGG